MKGNITPRGKGVWRLRVDAGTDPRTGRRRVVSQTVRGTKRQAEDALAELVAGQRRRRAHSDETVADLLAQWLEHREPSLSPLTVQRYRQAVRTHLAPALGKIRLSRLTTYDLDRLYGDMTRAGHSPASVRKVHQVARQALGQAVRWRLIAENPADHASPPKLARSQVRPPAQPALVAALVAIEQRHPDFHAYLVTLAASGCRRAEVCALRWSDLDPATGVLTVQRSVIVLPDGVTAVKATKTETVRRVRLPAMTLAVLDRYRLSVLERLQAAGLRGQWSEDAYVFPVPWVLGRPRRPDVMTWRWAKLRAGLGLPGVRLHDLRHFAASQLVAGGVDLRTVMARQGWTTLATASRYIHVVDEDAGAADVMERVLGGR